mgnify:CR=1 FL=1
MDSLDTQKFGTFKAWSVEWVKNKTNAGGAMAEVIEMKDDSHTVVHSWT